MQKSHPRAVAGFTLLEVMVAVLIIAIAVVTLIGSQSQSVSLASSSAFEITASLLAREKLASLEAEEFDAITSDQGVFDDPYQSYTWQLEVEDVMEDASGIPKSGEILKMVTVSIGRQGEDTEVYSVRYLLTGNLETASEE